MSNKDEKLYKVIKPNILTLDPKTGKSVEAAVGSFLSLSDDKAKALVNKVELAPTAAQLKADALALGEAAKDMAAKAKNMLAKATGKKATGEEKTDAPETKK